MDEAKTEISKLLKPAQAEEKKPAPEEKKEEIPQKIPEKKEEILKPEKMEQEPKKEESKTETKKPEIKKEKQEVLNTKKEEPKPKKPVQDEFFNEINKYFEENKIKILETKVIRKNAEIDFEIEVPSSVGTIKYYCKAKNKKRCNDGDLATAYVQGKSKEMATLFLTKGELTKKAQTMLEKEFKNITFKKI